MKLQAAPRRSRRPARVQPAAARRQPRVVRADHAVVRMGRPPLRDEGPLVDHGQPRASSTSTRRTSASAPSWSRTRRRTRTWFPATSAARSGSCTAAPACATATCMSWPRRWRQPTNDVTLDFYLTPERPAVPAGAARARGELHRASPCMTPCPTPSSPRRSTPTTSASTCCPPINFNNKLALPNKLFDYVQARLGVLIGPSPEMVHYVEEYDLGEVAARLRPSAATTAGDREADGRVGHALQGERARQRPHALGGAAGARCGSA